MSKKKQSTSSLPDFIHNKHVFFTGIVLMIATLGLVIYDYSIGESIFDNTEVHVLGDQVTPTVTPYITPTNTP